MRADQAFLHIVDSINGAAHLIYLRQLCARLRFQLSGFSIDDVAAIKQILIFEKIGFKGEDLLHPQRPLLIPRARQTQRFIPGR